MKWYVWLGLIVLGAGFLRFYWLTRVPPALNSDEVAIGYNAYSILTTGKDEYGTRYPVLFRSFDDYKMPVYVYLAAGAMKVFGFGDFAVRFPSALAGTLTVLLTYFLTQELFRKKSVALVASFLLAISPWSVQFSRAGYEANVAVFFIVFGAYLFLRRAYVPSAILFSLSVWTYLTPRIFVPLFVAGLAIIFARELWERKIAVAAAVAVGIILLFPIVRLTLSPEGRMRAAGVSAFANSGDLAKSAARLSRDSGVWKIFDNRRITYAVTFLRGYFSHFDPNFLFLDKSIEKYRAPDVGLLYLFELPLLLCGLHMLAKRWNAASSLLFWWMAAAPVAAAFTLQFPHPVRTLVFLPTFQIISAAGLVRIWEKFAWARYAVVAVIAVSFIFYVHQYFVVLPVEDAQYWYAGRREMTQKLNALKREYDTIYVSNALDFPYVFYLYYSPVDPASYLAQGGTISGGFNEQNNRVANISFRSISTSLRSAKKILFVGLPGEVFKKSLIVDTISYPDATPAIVFFK